MLRLAVLVLLLANAGYYAWSEGLLRDWGWAPTEQSEPQRLQQQIQPENLRIVRADTPETPGNAAGGATAPTAPATPTSESTVCLQAGVFDQSQADTLRSAASAHLPSGSWSLEGTPIAGRWMVYMGRFADEDALEKKRAELRARKVPYDRPGAALEPGLSLGRFSTEEAAERARTTLGNQGVRTARVVQERTDATGFTLRVPAATDALRTRLNALGPALAGKTVRPCG